MRLRSEESERFAGEIDNERSAVLVANIWAALVAKASKMGLPGRRSRAVIMHSGQTQSSNVITPASSAGSKDLSPFKPTHVSW